MDLDKYLKGLKGKESKEDSEPEGDFDYGSESMKIVKRVCKCSDEDAEDLVMALCQMIEDRQGPGVTVKIRS